MSKDAPKILIKAQQSQTQFPIQIDVAYTQEVSGQYLNLFLENEQGHGLELQIRDDYVAELHSLLRKYLAYSKASNQG